MSPVVYMYRDPESKHIIYSIVEFLSFYLLLHFSSRFPIKIESFLAVLLCLICISAVDSLLCSYIAWIGLREEIHCDRGIFSL